MRKRLQKTGKTREAFISVSSTASVDTAVAKRKRQQKAGEGVQGGKRRRRSIASPTIDGNGHDENVSPPSNGAADLLLGRADGVSGEDKNGPRMRKSRTKGMCPAGGTCSGGPPHKYLLKKIDRPCSYLSTERESFAHIFKQSTVLIDRTLFLKVLMQVCERINKHILIAMPGGSGKSWILEMTKAFFERSSAEQIAENRAIFSHTFCPHNPHFAISREEHREFCAEHQSTYPVFHFDFNRMPSGLKELKATLSALIDELFGLYEALLDRVDEEVKAGRIRHRKAKKLVKDYWHWRKREIIENEANWASALWFLLDLAKQFGSDSGRGVMVLIDEYDLPIYQNENIAELEPTIKVIANFITIFISNPSVQMLLIFGRYRFPLGRTRLDAFQVGIEDDRNEQAPSSSWLSSFAQLFKRRQPIGEHYEYRVALTKCFGFLDEEVQELCTSRQFEWREEARRWYNGYALGRVPLYSSNSILKMLASYKLSRMANKGDYVGAHEFMPHFNEPSIMSKYFCPVFRSTNIAPQITALLNGHLKLNKQIETFTIDRMLQLVRHAHAFQGDPEGEFNVEAEELFLGLHASGYIIHVGQCEYRIPNEELRCLFQRHMADFHFLPKFQVPMRFYNDLTKPLRRILFSQTPMESEQDKAPHVADLVSAYEKLLNAPLSVPRTNVARNEHNMHTAFETAAYRIFGWTYFAGDDALKDENADTSRNRPDIVLCSETRKMALCVELKFGSSADKTPEFAIGQMLAKRYINEHPQIKAIEGLQRVVLLGVNGREVKQEKDGSKKMMNVRIVMECGVRSPTDRDVHTFLRRFHMQMARKYRKEVDKNKRKGNNGI